MFSSEMVVTLTILLGVGVLTREPSLFLLSLALLLAAAISRLWERFALSRVEYERRIDRHHALFGDEVALEVQVVNRKLLPLSWLEVEDELSSSLPMVKGRAHPSFKPGRAILSSLFALRPYERVRRRYRFSGSERGEHLIGPVVIRSGDLFGFVTCEETLPSTDTLIVCPRVVPVDLSDLPMRTPHGELRTQSWIFEDTTRMAGARDYRPEDGLRRIHWPASMRAQRLQSRVYEATSSGRMALFVNVMTGGVQGQSYACDPDVLEMSIVAAASIAQWGLEQGYQVGIYSNGSFRDGTSGPLVPLGRDDSRREKILVALGRLTAALTDSFAGLLAHEGKRLPYGTTVLLVSAALDADTRGAIASLKARGHGVVLIATGRDAPPKVRGITAYSIGAPEEWRRIPALRLIPEGGSARSDGACQPKLAPIEPDGLGGEEASAGGGGLVGP